MPKSRKRAKKVQVEEKPVVSRNIAKKPIGRIIIVILALSFVLSGLIGLVVVLVEAMQS